MNNIKEIYKYAIENNIPIMQEDGIKFLLELIKKNKYKNILEIGSAIGYSAINMSKIKGTNITTLEKDKERYLIAKDNIKNMNIDNINIIYIDALEYSTNDKYDLIFIDAAKGQYIKFFNKFKDNLNDNGVIVSDNMLFHGLVKQEERIKSKNLRQLVNKIRKYINFLKENEEFETKFYEIGDGVAVSKRRIND